VVPTSHTSNYFNKNFALPPEYHNDLNYQTKQRITTLPSYEDTTTVSTHISEKTRIHLWGMDPSFIPSVLLNHYYSTTTAGPHLPINFNAVLDGQSLD
jgi:hypothetical protein